MGKTSGRPRPGKKDVSIRLTSDDLNSRKMEGEKSLDIYPSNGSLTNPSKGNLGNPFGPELEVLFVNFVNSIKNI